MITLTVTNVEESEGARGRFLITVKLSGDNTGEEEVRTFSVFRYFVKTSPYFQGNIPTVGDFLTSEGFESLEACEAATLATVKAVSMLAYTDRTAKKLGEQLRKKGFSREATDAAVGFCVEKRYIREEEQLARLMALLCEKKLYGIRRIRNEVYQKGFPKETLDAVWEDTLCALDFEEALDKRMQKLKKSAFSTPKEKQKTYAALMRYGFSSDEIAHAYKRNISCFTAECDDEEF